VRRKTLITAEESYATQPVPLKHSGPFPPYHSTVVSFSPNSIDGRETTGSSCLWSSSGGASQKSWETVYANGAGFFRYRSTMASAVR
jgi:hypothetical protein